MPKQLNFDFKIHGGKRNGAGRPNRSGQRAHVKRDVGRRDQPVHVTLRIKEGLPNLRKKDIFKFLKRAVLKAREKGLHINHYAILSNHVHLIVEPTKKGLARAMQSFALSLAKSLNFYLKRTGSVFRDRYHQHILKTPREVKAALAYVLANQSHHLKKQEHKIYHGFFSSSLLFENWKLLFSSPVTFVRSYDEDDALKWLHQATAPPQTWLLRQGWMRA